MYNVTLIKGDGIGPEVANSARRVIDASGVNINWDIVNAGMTVYEKEGTVLPDSVLSSIEMNRVVLKGPITTPIGAGFRSVNVYLRKRYDLYANIRQVQSMDAVNTRYKGVDITIFRENTEGLYCGIDERIDEDNARAIKTTSKAASLRIIDRAFKYALENNKKKVTIVHKANILKHADGLFLECGRLVHRNYPDIALEEVIIDNMCMQLVMNPEKFEVIVTTNLYGDILSDLCAGLVGGLGLAGGVNINDDMAIFEAVHGSAPDIAGKDIANPTALILSGALMLKHLGHRDKGLLIERAVKKVIADGEYTTVDLGGTATTSEMTDAIIKVILMGDNHGR